jgi:PhzF family phenazine biosynthesis protein
MDQQTSPPRRRFRQVDVFTTTAFCGNPVAVILDADGLDTTQMQAIARWTNLSETTFALAPSDPRADYQLRIFTPRSELPFAGHPTIGSAHALIESGMVRPQNDRLILQCKAGLIELTLEPQSARIWLHAPSTTTTALEQSDRELLQAALGLRLRDDAMRIDMGPVWITAQIEDQADLLEAKPDMAAIAELSERLNATGVTVFQSTSDAKSGFEVRSFAPRVGVPEDPVCGSGNACVGALLALRGQSAEHLARQGRAIGRDGQIAVRYVNDGDSAGTQVWIGGNCVTCVEGELRA